MESNRDTTNFACQECGQIVSSQQHHDFTNCQSFKAGNQEVVEWFMTHGYSGGTIHYSDGVKARFDPHWEELQAKLKEWGLGNG